MGADQQSAGASPAQRQQTTAADAAPLRRRRRSLGRALVVEDDAILGMALADALHGGGAKSVEVCASIGDAMTKLETMRFDIVILDVHLADRSDGWALAELVKELGPKPPRIVFSTGSPEAIPQAIAEMGIVLEKPYDPEVLLAALHQQAAPVGLFAKLRETLAGN